MAAASLIKLNLFSWGTTREITVFNPSTNIYFIDKVSDEIKALVGINGLPDSPLEVVFPTLTDRDTFVSSLTAGMLSSYSGTDPLVLDNGRDTGRSEQTTTTSTTAGPEITTTEDPFLTTTTTAPSGSTSTTTSTTAGPSTTTTTTFTVITGPVLQWQYTDNNFSNNGTFKIYKNGILRKSTMFSSSGYISVLTGDVISASITTVSGVASHIEYIMDDNTIANVENLNGSVSLSAQAPLEDSTTYQIIGLID
jgi:hypothetical protein